MRDLLILVIVFGSIPFILARPWIGILMWYWIGLMVPHRLAWGIAVNFPVAQVVALAALVALLMAKDRKTIPLTRETVLLALFAAHVTVTTSFAWGYGAWDQWDKVMKVLLMTFLTPILIYGRQRIMWLMVVIVLSIGFYGFKGGIFSVLSAGSYRVWGPSGSFIGGNTALGMALIMVLPLTLMIARAVRERRVGIPILDTWGLPLSLFFYSLFGLSIIATIFTYSRGAWLGLLMIAPLIFFKMRYRVPIAIAGLLLAGSITALMPDAVFDRFETITEYQEDRSAMQRLQAWGVNWNMAKEHPIIGTGFNNFNIPSNLWLSYANWVEPWAQNPRAAHSTFFQVLGHHGFLGAGIYFLMLAFTMATLLRIIRESRRHESVAWMRDIAWALLVGIIGFLAAGAFLDMAYFTLIYVYIVLAVILRRDMNEAREKEPVTGVSKAPDRFSKTRRPSSGPIPGGASGRHSHQTWDRRDFDT